MEEQKQRNPLLNVIFTLTDDVTLEFIKPVVIEVSHSLPPLSLSELNTPRCSGDRGGGRALPLRQLLTTPPRPTATLSCLRHRGATGVEELLR